MSSSINSVMTFSPRLNPMGFNQSAGSSCAMQATNSLSASLTASPSTASLLERTGPVMKTMLANGTQAYVMQKLGMQKSAFFMTIPTSVLPPAVGDLLAKSLFEGSPETKRQLETLREQGVRIGAIKDSKFFTIVGETQAGQELALTNTIMDMLTRPVQDPATFNTLKANLVQQQQQQAVNPDAMLDKAMTQRLLGPQHPESKTPQQRAEELSAQTLQGMMAYHQTFLKLLGQGNTMLISPLPVESQQQTLIEAFNKLNAVGDKPLALTSLQENPKLGRHRNVLLPNETLKRALIKVSWKVPDVRDPDYPAYFLLESILRNSGGKNSFFNALRTEHGLVYAIDYNTLGHQLPQGKTFTPSVKVEFSKIGQAVEDIRNVTQNLCQNEISPAQLNAVQSKQRLELRETAETSETTGLLYMPWLHCPGAQPPNLQNLQAAINRVTPADIKRVANRVFNSPNSLQMMGVSAPTAVLQQWFPGQQLERQN